MSAGFSVFPEGVVELQPNSMLLSGKNIAFPPDTNVDFVGAMHQVRFLDMLDPALPILADSTVVALEHIGATEPNGSSNPYGRKEVEAMNSYANKLAVGEIKHFPNYWGHHVVSRIGKYCLQNSSTVPRILFVDIHSKQSSMHQRNVESHTLRKRALDNQRNPQQTLVLLRSRAQYMHYREKTVVGQLSQDATLEGSGQSYGLVMGMNHKDIVPMLKKSGVSTTMCDTAFSGFGLDWVHVMQRAIRYGNEVDRGDMPQDVDDWRKVRIYDDLQQSTAALRGISEDEAQQLATAVSALSLDATDQLAQRLAHHKSSIKRVAKSNRLWASYRLDKAYVRLMSLLDGLEITFADSV